MAGGAVVAGGGTDGRGRRGGAGGPTAAGGAMAGAAAGCGFHHRLALSLLPNQRSRAGSASGVS